MKRTTILAVALAAVIAATGAAVATPGSTAPTDASGAAAAADAAGGSTAATAVDESTAGTDEETANDTAERGQSDAVEPNASERAGPSEQLPDPVPDFVSDIHGLVGQFLDGSIDSLGSEVSDAADDGAESGDERATPA
jgi:hypothetical protein